MREAKKRFLDEAVQRAADDPRFAAELGTMLLVGLCEIRAMEQYAGTGLRHTYITHFNVPDEGPFQFTVERFEGEVE